MELSKPTPNGIWCESDRSIEEIGEVESRATASRRGGGEARAVETTAEEAKNSKARPRMPNERLSSGMDRLAAKGKAQGPLCLSPRREMESSSTRFQWSGG